MDRKNMISTSEHLSESIVEIPNNITPEAVPNYMKLNGIEKGFQTSVKIDVSKIELDDEVVDPEHVKELGIMIDLDQQAENVSLVQMANINGDLMYVVTNGHHRVQLRKYQSLDRDQSLTINAVVRYGVSEAEIYEMRLADLNTQLTGVLFLRISSWLNSAFVLRSWSTSDLSYAIDSGQLTVAQVAGWAKFPNNRSNFKYNVDGHEYSISQDERSEVIHWMQRMNHNMRIDFGQLKKYLEIAALAPTELIARVEIKSGGGHKGNGKITFDFLSLLALEFKGQCPKLQIAIADTCVELNISAKTLRQKAVLPQIHEMYLKTKEIDRDQIESLLMNVQKAESQIILPSRTNHSSDNDSKDIVSQFYMARLQEDEEVRGSNLFYIKIDEELFPKAECAFDPDLGIIIDLYTETTVELTKDESILFLEILSKSEDTGDHQPTRLQLEEKKDTNSRQTQEIKKELARKIKIFKILLRIRYRLKELSPSESSSPEN